MTTNALGRLLGQAAVALSIVAGLPSPAALAQAQYPSRPVTIVVPYPAGGLADLAARPLAAALEHELKQPFIVLNKPGAAGGIATGSVQNAPTDGYTMLLTLASITTLPALSAATNKPALFSREQFVAVARLIADPCVIFVNKDSPWKTFGEFIADAKKRPDAITYASSGLYGPTHLPSEMLQQETGIKIRHIPTTGGAPAMNMLVGGHVDMFFTVPALAAQFIESGQLRALAVSSDKRIAVFPSVPTLKELGVNVEYAVWAGLFMNKDVPASVRDTVASAVAKIAADPAFKESIAKTGSALAFQDAAEFQVWWDKDAAVMNRIIKKIAADEASQ